MAIKKNESKTFEVVNGFLAAHDTGDRINRYLIENLPPAVWRAQPPGGKGRTVAAIFAHIHNVRLMWLKSAGWQGDVAGKIEGDDYSQTNVADALESSSKALRSLLSDSLTRDGKIRGFKPDVCSFMAYLFAHEGHHRGQISMQARQLGHPLPQGVMYGLWEWGTR